jgi:hypothetical protein
MAPIQRIDSSANGTNRPSNRAHSAVGSTVASRMMMPPIVGVPRLPWCVAGPSARMICPTLCARSFAMMVGPTTKAIRSAVTIAAAARKLM